MGKIGVEHPIEPAWRLSRPGAQKLDSDTLERIRRREIGVLVEAVK